MNDERRKAMTKARIADRVSEYAEGFEREAQIADRLRLSAKRGTGASPTHYGEKMLGKAEAFRQAAQTMLAFRAALV